MADVTKKIAVSLDMLGNKLKGFALDGIQSGGNDEGDEETTLTTLESAQPGDLRIGNQSNLLMYCEKQTDDKTVWQALAKNSDVKELLKWKAGIEAEELWGKTGFSLSPSGGTVDIDTNGIISEPEPKFSAGGLKPIKIEYTITFCGTTTTDERNGENEIAFGVGPFQYEVADTDREKTLLHIAATATYENGKKIGTNARWTVRDRMYIFLKEDKSLDGVDRKFMSANAVKTSTAKGGTYNVDLANDSYILFGVPQGLGTINSIKSAGFDVPFELVGQIQIPGTFNVYATSNKIAAGNGYSLVIA